jgi:hypothetical protein
MEIILMALGFWALLWFLGQMTMSGEEKARRHRAMAEYEEWNARNREEIMKHRK